MNTESFRGLRAKLPLLDEMPILDDCPITLDDIYEIIFSSNKKETIKIVGDTLCIE